MKTRQVLVKKNKHSTFSGDKLFLKFLTMRQAAEKILSDGTEVAGTHSSCLASWATIGKRCSFLLHHSKASSGCNCGSLMKQSTSLVASGSVAMPSKNDIAVSFLFCLGGASFSPSIGLLAEIMCCTYSRRLSCTCDCFVGVKQIRWLWRGSTAAAITATLFLSNWNQCTCSWLTTSLKEMTAPTSSSLILRWCFRRPSTTGQIKESDTVFSAQSAVVAICKGFSTTSNCESRSHWSTERSRCLYFVIMDYCIDGHSLLCQPLART